MDILDYIYKIITVIVSISGILALVGNCMGIGDSWVEQNLGTRKHKLVRLISNTVLVFVLLLLVNILCFWIGNDIHYDNKVIIDSVNVYVVAYDLILLGFIIYICFKQKRLHNKNIVVNWQVVIGYIGMCIMQFAISSTYHEFSWFLTIINSAQITYIWTFSWVNTYDLDKAKMFFVENGEKKYIYHRLNDAFVICGKERNMGDKVEMKVFSEIKEVQFLTNEEKNCENSEAKKDKQPNESCNSEMITNNIEKQMFGKYKEFLKNELTKMQFEAKIKELLKDKKINVESEIERTKRKKMKNNEVKIPMLQFVISILVPLLPILTSLTLGITTIVKDGIYTEISALSNEIVVEPEMVVNVLTENSTMLSELLLKFTTWIVVGFIIMLIIGVLADWVIEGMRVKKNHFYSMLEEILKKENTES